MLHLVPNCPQKNCFPLFLQTGKELLSNYMSVSLNTTIKFLSLPIPSCPLRKDNLRKGRRPGFLLHTSFLQLNQGQREVGSPPSALLNKGRKNLNQTHRVRERKTSTKVQSDQSYRCEYTAITHWYKTLFS